MNTGRPTAGRPDYGIDAPTVVRNLTIASAATAVGSLAWWLSGTAWSPVAQAMLNAVFFTGLSAAVMVWSSRRGKFAVRDRLLDSLPWRGDERVLDVGCGRGLAAIGAAKRLTTGEVIGVDIWSQGDLSNNSPATALANAEAEGVAARVRFETGDARRLPFDDASFDAVVSMTALHNIPSAADRALALQEIARVLRPGGRLALFDIFKAGEYAKRLEALGFTDIVRSGPVLLWLVPGRRITAVAPTAHR